MAEKTCAHEGCTCVTTRDDGYCSDSCASHEGHEGTVPHACHCGHSVCEADASS